MTGSSGRAYLMQAAQADVGEDLERWRSSRSRQKAASFNLDEVMEQMKKPGGG